MAMDRPSKGQMKVSRRKVNSGKIFFNPFLNSLRDFRKANKHKYEDVCELTKKGAQIWRSMSEREKSPYVNLSKQAPKYKNTRGRGRRRRKNRRRRRRTRSYSSSAATEESTRKRSTEMKSEKGRIEARKEMKIGIEVRKRRKDKAIRMKGTRKKTTRTGMEIDECERAVVLCEPLEASPKYKNTRGRGRPRRKKRRRRRCTRSYSSSVASEGNTHKGSTDREKSEKGRIEARK